MPGRGGACEGGAGADPGRGGGSAETPGWGPVGTGPPLSVPSGTPFIPRISYSMLSRPGMASGTAVTGILCTC